MKKQYDFSKGRRGPALPVASGKSRIAIRLDDDALAWFRDQAEVAGGASYQAMINEALRRTMESKAESVESTLRRVLREELPRLAKASTR
jgi:uncharacterized protein (DUF4415 family)